MPEGAVAGGLPGRRGRRGDLRRGRLPERRLAVGATGRQVVAERREVNPGPLGRHPALRRPVQEADPEEERLVDVLDRLRLLREDRAQGGHAHGAAAELLDDGREQAAVGRVEADHVDLEDAHRLLDGRQRDPAVTVDLRVVAHASKEPVDDPRGGPPAAGDGGGGLVRHLDSEDPGRAADDRDEVLLGVEVEPVDRPEAIAQRPADAARPGGGADDRERPQGESQRSRRGPLPDHDVEGEVLHRRVEDLLHRPVEAVDLVDEEHVAIVERGEDGGQVAGPLDRRAGRVADVDPQLASDDGRQGRLAEAGRPVEEDVVRGLAPLASRREEHRQARLHLALAQVLVHAARAQGALDLDLGRVDEVRSQELRGVGHPGESTMRRPRFAQMFDTSRSPRPVRGGRQAVPPEMARRAALTRSSSVVPGAVMPPTTRDASRASASV